MSYNTLKNPACYLYGPGIAKIEGSPLPEISDPHDVIVRIGFVGVCGSDVHFWTHGGIRRKVSPERPLILGHETTGTVHSIGTQVTTVAPGDPVSLEPGIPCRRCTTCKSGSYNLCSKMQFAACPPSSHGTLVRYYKLPEDFCYKLPKGVSLQDGVLIEPLAVAVHACKLGDVRLGAKLVVFGAGTVGLLCAAVARAMGATTVVVVDTNPSRLDFAKKFAAADVYLPPPPDTTEVIVTEMMRKNNLWEGADIVLEATGVEPCIAAGIQVLREGGTFVQVGLGKTSVQFPIVVTLEKELVVKGCFRYATGDFEMAVQLLETGKVRLDGLVSNVVEFENAMEAWEMTRKGVGIKNIIRGPVD